MCYRSPPTKQTNFPQILCVCACLCVCAAQIVKSNHSVHYYTPLHAPALSSLSAQHQDYTHLMHPYRQPRCVWGGGGGQLKIAPPWGRFFVSCNQFSPAAILRLLVQASLNAGQAYAQLSSACEAVRVRRPLYIFSPGQQRVKLCHHFGFCVCVFVCVTPKCFNQCSNCEVQHS